MTPRLLLLALAWPLVGMATGTAEKPLPLPRCRAVPLPNHQVTFLVDGRERLRWHFGPEYPRPFFFPFIGPAGSPLTRMGHPGAPNHDHHRSIWFAHAAVEGIDFWADHSTAQIRQKQWLIYEDGDQEAVMGVLLSWQDGAGQELLEQELIVAVRPSEADELELELQSTFRPGKRKTTELRQSNFGFLAVRVAKSISTHFGGGEITSSEGGHGEAAVFGQPARWMDYSGPVPTAIAQSPPVSQINGITYYDHATNPGYPSRWHVREDGWMGASVCRESSIVVTEKAPLMLRYLLRAHGNAFDPTTAERIGKSFNELPAFQLQRSHRPHREFELSRTED